MQEQNGGRLLLVFISGDPQTAAQLRAASGLSADAIAARLALARYYDEECCRCTHQLRRRYGVTPCAAPLADRPRRAQNGARVRKGSNTGAA